MKKLLIALLLITCTLALICSCESGSGDSSEHTHEAAGTWKSNSQGHWHPCRYSSCNERLEFAPHSETAVKEDIITSPTATALGEKNVIEYCTACNYEISVTKLSIPALGEHKKGSLLQGNKDGHYYACTDEGCDVMFDFAPHNSETLENVTLQPGEITDGEKTVTVRCRDCGYVISETKEIIPPTSGHHKGTDIAYDSTGHYYPCTDDGCNYQFDKASHVYTCTQIGETDTHERACACGYTETADCIGSETDGDDASHWSICASCGGNYGVELHNHDGGRQYDSLNIWYVCSCGKEVDRIDASASLHIVTSAPSLNNLYTSGATAYTVVFDSTNQTVKTAVQYLNMHLKTAVGASPSWHSASGANTYDPDSVSWSEDAKYIVIGNHSLFAKAGLAMPSAELLGETGYYIVTKGQSVFIMAHSDGAYQRAVHAFLREVIGFEAYAAGSVSNTVPVNKTVNLPTLEVIEKPDIDYYLASNAHAGWVDGYGDEYYMMGFDRQATDLFINVTSTDTTYTKGYFGGVTDNNQNNQHTYNPWHNTLDFLPNKDYRSSHPKWYSDNKFGYNDSCRFDLCLTAHGNESEYNAMVAEMAKQMLVWIDNNPDKPIIALTMEDHNTGICTCSSCTSMKDQYNGSDAAALVKFVNAVNRIIQQTLEDRAIESGSAKREIKIVTFAYHQTYKAPAIQNSDGTWSPVDSSVVCDPEVAVMVAPIEMDFGKSILDPDNKIYKDAFDAWASCTDEIFVWAYNTNFKNYMYPCYTVETMVENYRYFKSIGANYIWAQGQHNVKNPTGFSVMKDYINSKALFDLTVDTQTLVDNFFENYFRDASQSMRTYYDELSAHLATLIDNEDVRATDVLDGVELGRVTHVLLNDPDFWTKEQLDGWMDDINSAYAAIKKYEVTSPTLHETLEKRIKLESIFIRYAQIDLYGSSYDSATLLQMKQSFKADCAELGITLLAENQTLDATWTKWGI